MGSGASKRRKEARLELDTLKGELSRKKRDIAALKTQVAEVSGAQPQQFTQSVDLRREQSLWDAERTRVPISSTVDWLLTGLARSPITS